MLVDDEDYNQQKNVGEAKTNISNMFTGDGIGSTNRANRDAEGEEERMYRQIMQRQKEAMNLNNFERQQGNFNLEDGTKEPVLVVR